MKRLLFSEEAHTDKRYLSQIKFLKYCFFVIFAILAVVGIGCLVTVRDDPYAAPVCFGFGLFMLALSVYYACMGKQYLYVYGDCVRCKMPHWRRERVLACSPDRYRIQLKPVLGRSRLTLRLLFLAPDGRVLLRYGACTLRPSRYQAEKEQWETDLFAIGCEIIDENEIIVNR